MTAMIQFKNRLLSGLSAGLSQVRRLATNNKANISVLAGVTFIPFTIAVTAAVDLSNAIRIKGSLQAAADAGVLAAATALASGYDDTDKSKIAKDTFFANLSPTLMEAFPADPEVVIDFTTRTVHMDVRVNTDQLLTSLITDSITIGVEATAIADQGSPVCLMALDPSAEWALMIRGTALVQAEECAVQVNSNHVEAMRQTGGGKAYAESFCVHGDYVGTGYTPLPRRHCMAEKDPLAKQFALDLEALNLANMGCRPEMPKLENNSDEISMSPSTHKGAYCGSVNVSKGTLILEPGVHVFRSKNGSGGLSVSTHAKLMGEGVTILLTGEGSKFYNQAQANIDVSAPAAGELFAGIVLAQHPDSTPPPNGYSEIIGGGDMIFDGIVYYPTQHLKISGGGNIGALAAQFAILANTIKIDGNGELTIKISSDAMGSGLPGLPEAHEVIRLIK